MKVYRHFDELKEIGERKSVVTIGNFDGVHLGHQRVLSEARRIAEERKLSLSVLTFEPHPATLFNPDGPNLQLSLLEDKLAKLERLGVDLVLAQQFDEEFASMTAAQFFEKVLLEGLGAQVIMVGENFRFGRAKEGNIEVLHTLSDSNDIEVVSQPMVDFNGQPISSTRIRELLADGKVGEVTRLLGHPHEISGRVVEGMGEGRELGFPTINLSDIETLVPGDGVFAAEVVVDGIEHPAAAYVGRRPTLGHGYSFEAHILDFEGDLYGSLVTLRFIKRVRGEAKFDSREELVVQMARDIEHIRYVLTQKNGAKVPKRDSFVTPAMADILLGQNLVAQAKKVISKLEEQHPGDGRIAELQQRAAELSLNQSPKQHPTEAAGRDRVKVSFDSDGPLQIRWELTDDGLALAKRTAKYSGREIVRLFTAAPGPRGVRTTTRDFELEINVGRVDLMGLPRPAVFVVAAGFLANTGQFVPLCRTEPLSVER